MICPKCGNECEDELMFCNKCGTKLKTFVHKRVSESEKKAQSNTPFENIIGGMTGEAPDEDTYRSPRERRNDKKKAEQMHTESPNALKGTLQEGGYESTSMPAYSSEGKKYSGNKKKSNTKLKVLLVVLIAMISVAAAVFVTLKVKETTMTKKFDRYYKQGNSFYDSGNYKDAKTQFINASKNAFTKEQKIKSYSMVYKLDALIGGYVDEEIKYLEALVDVDNTNIEYFKDLIILYQNNDMGSKIETLINSASSSIRDELKEFDGTIPVASVEEGKYDKPIAVELTATDGVTIYYTTDGSNVEESSSKKEYSHSIKLNEEGKYTIRAYSVDKNGKSSKEMIVRYTLDFNSVNPPKVSLDSGKYTDGTPKKITVKADSGCTVYYTEDGSMPTKKSKKYKKAIKLPKGNSLYYFVAMNADGVVSNVVTRAYEYTPQYSYSYSTAMSNLNTLLVSSGVLENKYGEFENGDVAYLAYNSTKDIDDDYYYIITCEIDDANGSNKSVKYYAVSASTGQCYKASGDGDSYKLKSLQGE